MICRTSISLSALLTLILAVATLAADASNPVGWTDFVRAEGHPPVPRLVIDGKECEMLSKAFLLMREAIVMEPAYGFTEPFFPPGAAYGRNWWQLDSSTVLEAWKWCDFGFCKRSIENFRKVQCPDGRIPLWGCDKLANSPHHSRQKTNVSSLPALFKTAHSLATMANDPEFARRMYELNSRYLGWWRSNRVDRTTGLVSSVFEETFPPWLGVSGEYAGVDTGVLVALGAEWTAEIADSIGRDAEAADLRAFSVRTFAAMRERMWDGEKGLFRPYRFATSTLGFESAEGFYMFADRDLDVGRRAALLRSLTGPRFAWRRMPLASMAVDSPHYTNTVGRTYQANASWSGNVWSLINRWTVHALLRAGYEREAVELARATKRMIDRAGTFDEFYLTTDGSAQGGEKYLWTAADYAILVIEDLLGISYDGKAGELRVRPRIKADFRLENLSLPDGSRVTVSCVGGKVTIDDAFSGMEAKQAGDLCGTWEFRRTAVGSNAVQEAWQRVRVPHDWAIAGPFDPDSFGGSAKLPWIGKGEYRRSFEFASSGREILKAGGKAYLVFDGVMAKPHVFVNGRDVGGCDYGYASFALDVTAALRDGANEVGITVDTTEHKSRWYPGAGIYRRVRLRLVPRGGAIPFSAQVVTESLSEAEAVLRVSFDAVGGGHTVRTERIARPHRWSVEDPFLYTIDVGGEKVRYGLRSAVFTADDGFYLNGKRLQLKGVDLHSDLGLVGMAFDPDIARRQLLLMKDLGVNAIRTSHNPPAPQFLDLCDEMGFVVWDECFDKWDGTSGRPSGVVLEDYVSDNLRAFVRRDRNHPSVVLWSIGNEMRIRTDVFADGVTSERVRMFREAVRAEDPTRPVAAGCDLFEYVDAGLWDDLDVTGWNYGRRYGVMHRRKPEMPLVYSESASAYSDYGFYSVPPAAYRDDYSLAVRKTDSYDHTSAPWSDIPDIEFLRMETDRFVAGEFVWTGIDYLGEPCPYTGLKDMPEREQARSSYFGITDLCGIPKDRYWLYRSHWRSETTTCHILPHWNWTKGTRLPVYVYTNGDEAELFLNGKSLGRRKKKDPPKDYTLDFEGMDVKKYPDYRSNPYYAVCDKYRLRWHDVVWEPGELKAVCYRGGVRIGEAVVRTCGKPVAVRLTEDPAQPGGTCPLRFYQIDVVDAVGTRDPLAMARVAFRTEGPIEIVAAGNGDPRCYETFPGAGSYPLYYGKALVIVRRLAPGRAALSASVDGLDKGKVEVK